MPIRLPIKKLAASPVMPLKSAPRFKNDLLRSDMGWAQRINYLREIYMEVYVAWEANQPFTHEEDAEGNRQVSEVKYDPEMDKELFSKTEPLLRELILGASDISKQRTMRMDVYKAVENAEHDFGTASSYAKAGDYAMATVYQSYALMKLHNLLDGLTSEANKGSRKLGYGYDTSGEAGEKGGTSGQDNHLWDTGNGSSKNRTPHNPANQMVDAEAEIDFPELRELKHKRVHWPPRTR